VVVVAGDHGCGEPGISLGASHPTVVAARAIADGTAALARLARPTPIVLVDAGTAEVLPDVAIRLGDRPTQDVTRGPAMTEAEATRGLEAGIALGVSLSETVGLDVVVLGALGVGADVSAAALLADGPPLDCLARFGGPETPVLAGLILATASMMGAIVLDGPATGAAARVACRLCPAVVGYLIAAHRNNPAAALLGLEPVFDVGLGHGDGAGAAMVLPLVDRVVALLG
jgi:nicotinate-nucleotide--dimethylbenzimidazole phosphoribosyltransferase